MNSKQYGHLSQGEALPKKAQLLTDILPINEFLMAGKFIKTVNARELHTFLGVGRGFSTWVQDRIAEYGFIEGMDYTIVEALRSPNSGSTKARPQRVKEYLLALDMAKELSMVERNTEGRRARRYFIDCERRLAEVAPQQQVSAQAHWQAEREASKDYHGLMCRALQQHRTRLGKETAGHHYSNELGMINRLVLGMDGKAWLAQHGLKGEVRKHLSAYQLALVAFLERSNATFLDADMPFAERKMRLTAMLATRIEREGGENDIA
ncbi:antA/AntB antirepressor family protein [Aeromonas hydrophila]|uniref:antA/AntB antirepressor family protein n=1 Tax=Aeromonas hydrophila TaxID=644 RepID=UPI002B48B9A6|nr:antA/AntB antirepressor family protein [Aeromonas hydrophila]